MLIHFTVFCISTIIAFIRKNELGKYPLIFIFIFIFIYISIRYNYGADYTSYEDMFSFIKDGGQEKHGEIIFVYLLSLFSHYYYFIFFTSFLLCFSFFYIFRHFIDQSNYWICLLFFFLEPSLLLNNLVAMRSAIVVCIFIFSLKYLISSSFCKYFLSIILASLFHTSAVILVPLYFSRFIKINTRNRLFTYLFIISFTLSSNIFIENVLVNIVSSFTVLQRYNFYLSSFTGRSVYGYIAQVPYYFFLGLLFFIYNKVSAKEQVLIKIGIMCLFIHLLGIDSVGRFLMYFWPIFLVCINIILLNISSIFLKFVFLLSLLLSSLLSLFVLYTADYGVSFLIYKTIFSATYLP